ncbi:MAG: YfiR family protein [Gammaproteobacteria bacterium]|nr:YfiR family protein [Gammaproteobacteria bacterium]MDH3429015.1 YfiR family protein [Gammaproteobacteria bacterium]
MKDILTKNRIAFGLAFALLFAHGQVRADTAAEVAVKAAVMHKIAKFVSWPEAAFESRESPIRFCILDHHKMFDALRKFDDRPIHGRPVRVLHMPEAVNIAASCDVLYVSPHEGQTAVDWLQSVANSPVLTFGEIGTPGAANSIVKVSIRRDKVRFAINTDASDRAGLSISGQLLQLAAALGGGGV